MRVLVLFLSKNATLFTFIALALSLLIFFLWNQFRRSQKKDSIITSENVTIFFGFFGLVFVISQMSQSNSHKKWDNYNSMNQAYGSLYAQISSEMLDEPCRHFSQLSQSEKKWIRNYFDLYAEEYWLDKRGLIPSEMFDKLIAGGVKVNFQQYPVMVTGYDYWQNEGAFGFPTGFKTYLEDKIMDEWKTEITKSTQRKCGAITILPQRLF